MPPTRPTSPEEPAARRSSLVEVGRVVGGVLWQRWTLVAVATFAFWLASHALRPLLSIHLDALGASDAEIGFVIAAYPVVALVLAIPAGRLVDRVGVTRILVASYAAMMVVGLAYTVASEPWQLLLVALPNGVAELGVWLCLQSLISHAGSGQTRSRNVAVFSLAWGLGMAVGPLVGANLYAAFGFVSLGLTYSGASILGVIAIWLAPRPKITGGGALAEAGAPSTPWRDIRRITTSTGASGVLIATFVGLFVNSLRLSFYPLYLDRAGVPLRDIGVLLTVVGIAILVIRVPLPTLQRRLGAGRFMVIALWVSILAISLTPWLTGSYVALFLAAVLMGFGYGVISPITVDLMGRLTSPRERGLAMGLRVTANRLAQVIQPVVFAGVATVWTMAAAFPISGALLAACTVQVQRDAAAIDDVRA